MPLRADNVCLQDYLVLHGFDYKLLFKKNLERNWLTLIFTSIYSLYDNVDSRNQRHSSNAKKHSLGGTADSFGNTFSFLKQAVT